MEARRASQPSHILLTGPPDIIKKTTICRAVADMLETKHIPFDGFYIIRNHEHYNPYCLCDGIEFDIIRMNTKETLPLARPKSLTKDQEDSRYHAREYNVFLNNFERVALPVLDSNTDILLIGEIDKMELLSKKFKRKITNIFFSNSRKKKAFVIGIIPQIHRIPQQHTTLFHKLYTDERIEILNISYDNERYLPQHIIRRFSQSHVD